jgi:hypothetical protein
MVPVAARDHSQGVLDEDAFVVVGLVAKAGIQAKEPRDHSDPENRGP